MRDGAIILCAVFSGLLMGFVAGAVLVTPHAAKQAEQRCMKFCECPLTKSIEHVPQTEFEKPL